MRYQVFYRTSFIEPFLPVPETASRVSYREIGVVEAHDLEDLFRVMNVVDGSDFEMPQKLRCRSMSTGDIAVDDVGQAYYCATVGWDRTKLA
jgi:hypothetical protein